MGEYKLNALTKSQKIKLLKQKMKYPLLTQRELSIWAKDNFQLQNCPSQSTISKILNDEKKLLLSQTNKGSGSDFRTRSVMYPLLEKELLSWILQKQANKI